MDKLSLILLVVGGLLLLFSLLPKNSNFLDIRSILKEHLEIFKSNPLQCIGVFIAPIFIAIGISLERCVTADIVNNLILILTILIGMYLSILGVLCAFDQTHKLPLYSKLLKETFTTTMFEIILCLGLLIIAFLTLFIGNYERSWFLQIISTIIYYSTIVILLNTLVVIKRLKVLFDNK